MVGAGGRGGFHLSVVFTPTLPFFWVMMEYGKPRLTTHSHLPVGFLRRSAVGEARPLPLWPHRPLCLSLLSSLYVVISSPCEKTDSSFIFLAKALCLYLLSLPGNQCQPG